jgi:hypothetical protein
MKLCNLDYLKSITPKSNAFAIQMLKLFVNDTAEAIKNIDTAIKNSNWLEVHKNAHKIKPSVLMLGFPLDMTEALLNILKYSQSGKNTDKIYDLFKLFETKISSVYYELDQELKKLEK